MYVKIFSCEKWGFTEKLQTHLERPDWFCLVPMAQTIVWDTKATMPSVRFCVAFRDTETRVRTSPAASLWSGCLLENSWLTINILYFLVLTLRALQPHCSLYPFSSSYASHLLGPFCSGHSGDFLWVNFSIWWFSCWASERIWLYAVSLPHKQKCL